MNKVIFSHKLLVVIGLSLICALPAGEAFARGEGGRRHDDRPAIVAPRRHDTIVVRNEQYHYRDGRFFRRNFFGFFFPVPPPFGAVVAVLPVGHTTVMVGGYPYYYYDRVYYKPCPSGYMVVAEPRVNTTVIYSQPAPVQTEIISEDTISVLVPNVNGSYTSVKLVKRNNGYVGPQGEYYPEHPTIAQLKVLYGG
ncbi:MAG: DUF6515 family protein [Candidatus Omnitrophica bacterium]|nr:DUF6515 family protein [Candidatus Omnitrophota bacterium]